MSILPGAPVLSRYVATGHPSGSPMAAELQGPKLHGTHVRAPSVGPALCAWPQSAWFSSFLVVLG